MNDRVTESSCQYVFTVDVVASGVCLSAMVPALDRLSSAAISEMLRMELLPLRAWQCIQHGSYALFRVVLCFAITAGCLFEICMLSYDTLDFTHNFFWQADLAVAVLIHHSWSGQESLATGERKPLKRHPEFCRRDSDNVTGREDRTVPSENCARSPHHAPDYSCTSCAGETAPDHRLFNRGDLHLNTKQFEWTVIPISPGYFAAVHHFDQPPLELPLHLRQDSITVAILKRGVDTRVGRLGAVTDSQDGAH